MQIRFVNHIAFVLLCVLGGKMIWESFKKEDAAGEEQEASLGPRKDAAATCRRHEHRRLGGWCVFCFLRVNIAPAVSFIGITTLAISMAGVKIENVFGKRFRPKAELAGGIILVLIGPKILIEHLEIIPL